MVETYQNYFMPENINMINIADDKNDIFINRKQLDSIILSFKNSQSNCASGRERF